MKQQINLSLSKWVVKEILTQVPNKSCYVEELLIKNHIEKLKSNSKTKESNPSQFFSWNVQAQNLLAKLY